MAEPIYDAIARLTRDTPTGSCRRCHAGAQTAHLPGCPAGDALDEVARVLTERSLLRQLEDAVRVFHDNDWPSLQTAKPVLRNRLVRLDEYREACDG